MKTRSGFLMIMEFISNKLKFHNMHVLRNMLIRLNKFGKDFFLRYIFNQAQFGHAPEELDNVFMSIRD